MKLCAAAKENVIQIPRFVSYSQKGQLHLFTDASAAAYASVLYFVSDCTSKPFLLVSRNRLVPKRSKTTVPRLELLGATLGVTMVQSLNEYLPFVNEIHVWTDSTCVLGWVSSPHSKHPSFVLNHVKVLQAFSQKYSAKWHYCPTSENPADVSTRGASPEEIRLPSLWLNGPDWLPDQSRWPEASTHVAPVYSTISK